MKKLNDILKYYAFTLFSNKEVIRAYTKSWKVAIFAYILSLLILLTPIAYHQLLVSDRIIVNQFSDIELAFNDIYDRNIDCKISNSVLTCNNDISYEFESNNYLVVINKEFDYDIQIDNEVAKNTDNLIVFSKDHIFIRFVEREDGIAYKPVQNIRGYYSNINTFDFKEIYNNGLTDEETAREGYYLANTLYLFSRIKMSNLVPTLLLWLGQFILSTFLLIIPSAFLINYGNKKGQRADEYNFKGSLKISLVMLLGVSFICALIGILSLELTPILLTVFYTIRLLLIYLNQFTRRGQKYNIIKYKNI